MFGLYPNPRRNGRLGEPPRYSDGKRTPPDRTPDQGSSAGKPDGLKATSEPTSRGKRIAALLGAIVAIVLTFVYVYAIATGKIFSW